MEILIFIVLVNLVIAVFLCSLFSSENIAPVFFSLFVIEFIIFVISQIAADKNDQTENNNNTSDFLSSSERKSYSRKSYRSLTTGFKIKKYNPEGWRKKGGNNLFKQSGRKRKRF